MYRPKTKFVFVYFNLSYRFIFPCIVFMIREWVYHTCYYVLVQTFINVKVKLFLKWMYTPNQARACKDQYKSSLNILFWNDSLCSSIWKCGSADSKWSITPCYMKYTCYYLWEYQFIMMFHLIRYRAVGDLLAHNDVHNRSSKHL